MIRARARRRRRRLRPARHHRHPRRRRPARRADPVQGRHRRRGRRVRRRVGPAARLAALQGLRPLHGEARHEPHPDRRRRALARATCGRPRPRTRAWCRSPRATATASASAGWRARRSGWPSTRPRAGPASTPSPSGPTTSSPEVAQRYAGDLLVLTPWRPFGPRSTSTTLARRVIHTVSRLERPRRRCRERDPDARFVLERLTSMRRHGMTAARAARRPPQIAVRRSSLLAGVALHLPLATGSHLAEVERLMIDIVAAGPADATPRSGSAT